MKSLLSAAIGVAAALAAALPAAAEPSTCWTSTNLAPSGNMQGYGCDVTLVSGRNYHWVINNRIRVYPDFDQGRATVYYDGDRLSFEMELDDELDFRLRSGDTELVFAPPQSFKAAVRRRINAQSRQQRPTSRYADTIERTLFE